MPGFRAFNQAYRIKLFGPSIIDITVISAVFMPKMCGDDDEVEVIRRIAAPVLGGIVSATVLALAAIPAVYLLQNREQMT